MVGGGGNDERPSIADSKKFDVGVFKLVWSDAAWSCLEEHKGRVSGNWADETTGTSLVCPIGGGGISSLVRWALFLFFLFFRPGEKGRLKGRGGISSVESPGQR